MKLLLQLVLLLAVSSTLATKSSLRKLQDEVSPSPLLVAHYFFISTILTTFKFLYEQKCQKGCQLVTESCGTSDYFKCNLGWCVTNYDNFCGVFGIPQGKACTQFCKAFFVEPFCSGENNSPSQFCLGPDNSVGACIKEFCWELWEVDAWQTMQQQYYLE